jgi:hypothetical protein
MEEAFPEEATVPEMSGLTYMRGDGTILMCGGVAPFQWGWEMWIYVSDFIAPSEKIRVARIARGYAEIMSEAAGTLYAHAAPGNEKWISFLGFEAVATREIAGQWVVQWQKHWKEPI